MSHDPDTQSELATQAAVIAESSINDAGSETNFPDHGPHDNVEEALNADGAGVREAWNADAAADHDGRDGVLFATIADLLDVDRGDIFVRRLLESIDHQDSVRRQLTPLLRDLRRTLGAGVDEARAIEQFVDALDTAMPDAGELAAAVPILAAATARIIVRGLHSVGVQMDGESRRTLVRQAVATTRTLVGDRGAGGVELLLLVARHLVRHASRRGIAPAALADALPRLVARVSAEPGLMHRLARAGAPRSDKTGRGIWGRPRRFVLHSPVEITILAR